MERVASRAQTVVADVAFAAIAFMLAFWIAPAGALGFDKTGVPTLNLLQLVVLYAAHGFSARTSTALVGTLFGLIMISLLGWAASKWAHLTGVASEEDFVLSAAAPELQAKIIAVCKPTVAATIPTTSATTAAST